MKNKSLLGIGIALSLLTAVSCSKEIAIPVDLEETTNTAPVTRAVPTQYFNWETVDFMPTPSFQSHIDPPWHGQGALTYMYGPDILGDIKASDGWELLYSKFDSNSPSTIQDPYFILYNKYRGIMRVYFYLTTTGIVTSSYLQHELSVVSNQQTTMLNFMGADMVDPTQANKKNYLEILPQQSGGTPPLASNRWYMTQYELAYDPNIRNINAGDIRWSWNLSYHDITKFKFDGNLAGSLTGAIGASTTNAAGGSLKTLFQSAGTGIVSGIGSNFFDKHSTPVTLNNSTGNNLGIPKSAYESLKKGVNSALSSATGGFLGAAVNLLSAIVGGSSGGPTPISLTLQSSLQLEGTGSNNGAIPSTPVSFWVPGTRNIETATNYIPYYNKPLGVVYFTGKPTINVDCFWWEWTEWFHDYGYDYQVGANQVTYTFPQNIDYSNYLVINPEVSNIASVTIEKQDLIVTAYNLAQTGADKSRYSNIHINPGTMRSGGNQALGAWGSEPKEYGVRFAIRVTPHDGSPSSLILKTLKLEPNVSYRYQYD